MTKSKSAFLFSSRKLAKDRLFMWTFTFKELLGVKDTRKRWNRLLTAMKRTWPELQGIRVFEMHSRYRSLLMVSKTRLRKKPSCISTSRSCTTGICILMLK